MTKLVVVLVVSGPLKGHKYFVKSDSKILIGRSEEANIRIGYDDFCSRRHAIIYWEGDICLIEDLDSTNGTFVNNCQVHGKIELTILWQYHEFWVDMRKMIRDIHLSTVK